MDFQNLAYFLQICEDGSFSKAANRLFISQQGLSMSMGRLEKELKQKLFIRTTRGVQLTEAGLFLQDRANRIMGIYQECESYFDTQKGVKNVIPLASVHNMVGRMPCEIQRMSYNEHPEFFIQLVECVSLDVERMVESGEVPFGFCLGPIESNRLEGYFLFRKKIGFIVHVDHPLGQYKTIPIQKLKDQKLLVFNRKFRIYKQLQQLCRSRGFEPNYVFESDRIEVFYDMIRNNPTLMAHSLDYYEEHNPDPTIRTLYLDDGELNWDAYIAHRKDAVLTKAEKRFLQAVLDLFGTA